ncbi:MAG TPA: hypothetical protein PLK94_07095, partial [Alphaproteobacteria bacterium]|nr:hypothetical protein [Alphaproteobacteria bacterium]
MEHNVITPYIVKNAVRLTLSLSIAGVYAFLTTSTCLAQEKNLSPLGNATINATLTEAKALRLMDNQDWINARNQVMALKTSSMINLYEWMLYREDYDTLPFSRIANFIEKNPHWPNQTSLRKSAERNMPETLPADQVMVWFTKYPPLTGKGAIQFSNAARQIGKTNE